jgi:hypothetical protein
MIDTDAATITGVGAGGLFNGTRVDVRKDGGITTLTFHGDLSIGSHARVTATGANAAAQRAANTAPFGRCVTFDGSGPGTRNGSGGGAGDHGT